MFPAMASLNPANRCTASQSPRTGAGLLTVAMLVLSVLLAGCASLSEDQCRSGRWRDVGARDGRAGYPTERLLAHREACEEYGIAPLEDDYLAGYNEGLLQYCTPASAVREGLAGRSYQNVCPPPITNAFSALHAGAYAVWQARQEVDFAHRELDRLERERRADDTKPERRRELAEAIRRQERRLYRARDAVRDREFTLDLQTRQPGF